MTGWLKRYSLRVRVVAVVLLLQTGLLLLLAYNSGRVVNQEIKVQVDHRLSDAGSLLSAALVVPLAQRDLVTVRDVVEQVSQNQDFVYVRVVDKTDQVIAEYVSPDKTAIALAGTAVVKLAGQNYGHIEIGLNESIVSQARHHAMLQSSMFALGAIVFTWGLLWLIGNWLARQFGSLVRVSEHIANGEYQARLPLSGEPEIDRLGTAFNHMVAAVQDQVQQLRISEARAAAIADYTYDLEFWLSPEGTLLWVNPSIERLFGYSVDECMNMAEFPMELVQQDNRAAAAIRLLKVLRGDTENGYLFRALHKDGSSFWALANWLPIYDAEATYMGLRASIQNVDALKNTEDQLRLTVQDLRLSESLQTRYLLESEQERARLVALLSAMNLGILFVGADGCVSYHNPAFNRMWAIDESHVLIGQPVADALAKSTNQIARPEHFSRHLLSALESRVTSESYEIQLADGRLITELDYSVRDQEGRFIGSLWIYEDITHERQTAEQLIYLAERDPLTGLFNRHRFQNELTRVLQDCDRHSIQCAVMFFDLDEFKEINDNFGHRAGDALLMRVAGEVGNLVRNNEVFARLGGDEFAVLLTNIKDGEAEALAERVVRAVAQIPLRYEGRNLRVTTSLGIARYPTQSASADDLVAKADAAMYQAKHAGKNTWRVFREDSQSAQLTLERLTWNERIGRALERDLFRLYFQGVYHTSTRQLSHYEALIRMVDELQPEKIIAPGSFISIAEQSGRILEIDRWVVNEAIKTLAQQADIPGIAVNISARSFAEPGLPQYISEKLQQFNVLPQRLLVELTETAAVSDMHDAQRLIEALHKIGCGVCLDDFGTGFSSFAYLKHLHADVIKIDGMFIHDLNQDADNQVFVKAIVNIAQGMGKTVVAEYVENEAVFELLKQFGVDKVQGYLLDKPHALVTPEKLPA